MRGSTRRGALGVALAAGLLLGALAGRSPGAVLTSIARLSADPVPFALLLAGLYLVRSAVLWPISALTILVGFVYGPAIGLPIGLAGAVVTCLPPFALARYVRPDADTDAGLVGRLGERGERLVDVTGELRGIVAARLVPLPADAVSYAAGLSGVSLPAYAAGTFLGEFPWVIAGVLAGSSMRSLTVSGLEGGLPLVVGAAALAVLVLAGPAYRHVKDRREGGEPV
ncbi:MAG: TVP38/TMEM64 family protein [Haloarculaceae archaeon]